MREGRLRYLVAEARCYWCGTVAGTLEGGWPLMPGTLMFRSSGQHQVLAPARPASPTFRCGHCGGPLFVDDFDIVLLRSEKLPDASVSRACAKRERNASRVTWSCINNPDCAGDAS